MLKRRHAQVYYYITKLYSSTLVCSAETALLRIYSLLRRPVTEPLLWLALLRIYSLLRRPVTEPLLWFAPLKRRHAETAACPSLLLLHY
jgi:hypothetical protein